MATHSSISSKRSRVVIDVSNVGSWHDAGDAPGSRRFCWDRVRLAFDHYVGAVDVVVGLAAHATLREHPMPRVRAINSFRPSRFVPPPPQQHRHNHSAGNTTPHRTSLTERSSTAPRTGSFHVGGSIGLSPPHCSVRRARESSSYGGGCALGTTPEAACARDRDSSSSWRWACALAWLLLLLRRCVSARS